MLNSFENDSLSSLNYLIGDSSIHGKGVLASHNLKEDEIVGLGIAFEYYFFPYVTPELGAFINHSYNPSAYLFWDEDQGWFVKTIKPLNKGEEITVNYENTPWYIEGPLPHYV
jgi:hypothetical protein